MKVFAYTGLCIFFFALPACAKIYQSPRFEIKQSPKFEFASCLEVAPFSQKSLPQPLGLEKAKCGYLFVPENRGKINGRRIILAVVIVPSVSQPSKPDPIVYLAGGPGGSALFELESLINNRINHSHDLILMSQRGTLFAKPELICFELDAYYSKSLGLALDSSENRKAHITTSRACYKRLTKQQIDLSSYNNIENAADFADLKQALGIKNWNVFGVSYGSYLAQILMLRHPEGIRSVTLDSVVPLENSKVVASAAKNAREGFTNIFNACAAQSQCAARYPKLASVFSNLVNQLELKPLTTSVRLEASSPTQVVLDGGTLVNWLISESLKTSNFQNIPALIYELKNGPPEKIAKAYAEAFMIPAGLLAYGMTFGMICSGYMADQQESDVLTQGLLAFPDFLDSVLAPALHFSYVHDDCRIWRIPKTPKQQRVVAKSLIPTLILSGSFDAITPPSAAQTLAKTLPNSTKLTFLGTGHGVINTSSCAQKVFASFLADPTKPDITCVAKIKRPVFD